MSSDEPLVYSSTANCSPILSINPNKDIETMRIRSVVLSLVFLAASVAQAAPAVSQHTAMTTPARRTGQH